MALIVAGVLLAAVAAGYVLVRRGAVDPAPPRPSAPTTLSGGLWHVDERTGRVAVERGGGRTVTGVACERFAAAAGTAVCLRVENHGMPRLDAVILDRGLREVRRVPLAGPPSRARVSPGGRMAAWTVFVSGHDYASIDFSTRTSILDTRTGAYLPDLEKLNYPRELRARDLNVWGVTFAADENRFYATAATGGRTHLIEGDVARRTARPLRSNVECPSLSPDGRRIAFKKATGHVDRPWRVHVLDLRTMRETPLAEPESVDDQLAWLDDRTVAYERAGSVWSLPADGSGTPRRLIGGASSPQVLPPAEAGSPAGGG
ncbi:hypothetical protein D5H75_36810 [Bailinhaonella thermotolerans]|uniref:TolB n=1 Tax=Bailinhaonella thermotolerans TaxID=1070861 RepID=A0A3A4A4D4_9ACTN|nr:hypothetical protein D5H75_36810 [Bailinhaonella thermotolerans]